MIPAPSLPMTQLVLALIHIRQSSGPPSLRHSPEIPSCLRLLALPEHATLVPRSCEDS